MLSVVSETNAVDPFSEPAAAHQLFSCGNRIRIKKTGSSILWFFRWIFHYKMSHDWLHLETKCLLMKFLGAGYLQAVKRVELKWDFHPINVTFTSIFAFIRSVTSWQCRINSLIAWIKKTNQLTDVYSEFLPASWPSMSWATRHPPDRCNTAIRNWLASSHIIFKFIRNFKMAVVSDADGEKYSACRHGHVVNSFDREPDYKCITQVAKLKDFNSTSSA